MARGTTARRDPTAGNGGFEAKLWQTADALRNNMDAAEYKHVVLGLIFLKYISDAFEAKHAELEADRAAGADPEESALMTATEPPTRRSPGVPWPGFATSSSTSTRGSSPRVSGPSWNGIYRTSEKRSPPSCRLSINWNASLPAKRTRPSRVDERGEGAASG